MQEQEQSRSSEVPDADAVLDSPIEIKVGRLGRDGAVVALAGELCLATAGVADSRIRKVLEGGSTRLVLDLSQLVFLDSTGIRLLISLEARAQADGFGFGVVIGDGAPSRALELAGMTERPVRVDPAEIAGRVEFAATCT